MSICTQCGFKQENCNCKPKTVEFSDLHYSGDCDQRTVNSITNNVVKIRQSDTDMSKKFGHAVENIKPTATNVRKVALSAVVSIQTETQQLDDNLKHASSNFKDLKKMLENSTDGLKKWEKVGPWWTSNKPADVANHIQNGDWFKAQTKLAGLFEDPAKRQNRDYIRVTKAQFVTQMFGDPNALCMDSRRRRALSDLIEQLVGKTVSHPDERWDLDKFRARAFKADSKNAKVGNGEFFEEMLELHPKQYRLITGKIMDVLDKNTPGVPRSEIPQLIFNMAGRTSYHTELLNWIETED